MRYVLALTLCFIATTASAEPDIQEMLDAWVSANDACRQDTVTHAALAHADCAWRDHMTDLLAKAGYCFGRPGEPDERKTWHACDGQSLPTSNSAPR